MSPIDPDQFVLERAIRKLRTETPLTEEERAAVMKRGMELMDLTDEPLPPGEQAVAMDNDEAEELCTALVEAEADRREGKRGTPWRELFPPHGAG